MYLWILNNGNDNQVKKSCIVRENCLYLEFFWSVFSPNADKYEPEKLRTSTLFTQWYIVATPFTFHVSFDQIEAATGGVQLGRLFLKIRDIHTKTPELESLFNEDVGLQAWNFIE